MPFRSKVKEDSLIKSKRSCCICRKFAGRLINVHHIIQEAKGGSNKIENAIVLCLNCHGEVGHYNNEHPIGTKYTAEELIRHRNEWWQWCSEHPEDPPPNNPIIVTPNTITLTNEGCGQTIFNIYNKTDNFYYQLMIKISSKYYDPLNLQIDWLGDKNELPIYLNTMIFSGDIWMMWGDDESGRQALYMYISSLAPRAYSTFRLSEKKCSNIEKTLINLGIAGFSDQPNITTKQHDGSVTIPFTPPEKFLIKGVAFYFKKV